MTLHGKLLHIVQNENHELDAEGFTIPANSPRVGLWEADNCNLRRGGF